MPGKNPRKDTYLVPTVLPLREPREHNRLRKGNKMYIAFAFIFLLALALTGFRPRRKLPTRRCIAQGCTNAARGKHARFCTHHIAEYVKYATSQRASGFMREGK